MQGAAGMIPQPEGWLRQVTDIARSHGALLIADEVMTGFGRTHSQSPLFACQQENVQPDFLCLAKGMTGGYLPMAATLTTQKVFDAFLGEYAEFKTFFHGHSFTGNQLGAAAALASLDILQSEQIHPPARRNWKNICARNCKRSGRCRTSATSGRSGWWRELNWSRTGGRARRSICASARASACARRWRGAAC